MPLNLPTAITWLRVAIIPVLVGLFHADATGLPQREIDQLAAGLFLVAALSDWLDGWLARRLGQTSSFGAFLDPVADKLIVATALVELVVLLLNAPLFGIDLPGIGSRLAVLAAGLTMVSMVVYLKAALVNADS
ncbi:MAG: hypothetical protein EBT40_02585 [Betaproteobacteria bacterium]|nr:hypothetical protein [Betaproteobacteria bacterium]